VELSRILVLLWKWRTPYNFYVLGVAGMYVREWNVNCVDFGIIIVVDG
jgi:hypothetical protein